MLALRTASDFRFYRKERISERFTPSNEKTF